MLHMIYQYSILVEGLFYYNAHFIITLFSLGSYHERYNEIAVYRVHCIHVFLHASKAAKHDVAFCCLVCIIIEQVAQLWQRPREFGKFEGVGHFEAKF